MPSTAINSYSYSESEKQLTIHYVGGGDYVYFDVPPEAFEGLKAAASRGAYVNQTIKPHFRYERRDRPARRIVADE